MHNTYFSQKDFQETSSPFGTEVMAPVTLSGILRVFVCVRMHIISWGPCLALEILGGKISHALREAAL